MLLHIINRNESCAGKINCCAITGKRVQFSEPMGENMDVMVYTSDQSFVEMSQANPSGSQ